MRGSIHGIWLTKPGGKLHPEIIPNLSSWVVDASAADFSVVLWTNLNEIDPADVAGLKAAKIVVADHSLCQNNPLYKYFLNFLELAMHGDKSAFAMASDILRMAILDQTENNEYFIYVDANDIKLVDLSAKLKNLDATMSKNSLGYSFNVEPTPYRTDMFDTRNDVLIALKDRNLNFFKDYKQAYLHNLEKYASSYAKPKADHEALELENLITNQTSAQFFRVDAFNDDSIRVVAQFANYMEHYQLVNSSGYLNSQRIMSHGNTWLPVGDLKQEREELAKYNIVVDDKAPVTTQNVNVVPQVRATFKRVNREDDYTNLKYQGASLVVLCVLLLLTIVWWWLRSISSRSKIT